MLSLFNFSSIFTGGLADPIFAPMCGLPCRITRVIPDKGPLIGCTSLQLQTCRDCMSCARIRRSSEGYDDDRYRELVPGEVAGTEPASRRKVPRRRGFSCIGKQDSDETPVLDRTDAPAHRTTAQVARRNISCR